MRSKSQQIYLNFLTYMALGHQCTRDISEHGASAGVRY